MEQEEAGEERRQAAHDVVEYGKQIEIPFVFCHRDILSANGM